MAENIIKMRLVLYGYRSKYVCYDAWYMMTSVNSAVWGIRRLLRGGSRCWELSQKNFFLFILYLWSDEC